MDLPSSLVSDKIVEEKKIYFFNSTSPIGIPNHPHVCIKKSEDEYLFFVCCTSQEDTMNRLIKYQGLDPSTIVWIKKDSVNKLKRDGSYINCNNIYSCTKEEFTKLYNNKDVYVTDGNLSEHHYQQVINGLLQSNLVVEELKELFQDQSTL